MGTVIPFRKLLEGDGSDEEIERYVRSLAAWQCSSCARPMATKAEPAERERLCFECARPKPAALSRAEALERAGVPRRFASVEWVARKMPRSQEQPAFRVDHWTGDPWCVVLHGPSDAGKTTFAAELLWRLLPRYPGAQWRRAQQIQDEMRLFADSERRVAMAEACEASFLVVDDYGKSSARAGDRDGVDGVLFARHGEMQPTLVTTNLAPAQLLALDGGIGRRLVSDGVVLTLSGNWRDSKL